MPRSRKAPPHPLPATPDEHIRVLLLEAEIGEVPTLDLHGYSRDEAIRETEQFLAHEQWQGTESVRIIHGRGTEALRFALTKWITKQSHIVAGWRDMIDPRFAQACLAVALHRIKKPSHRK